MSSLKSHHRPRGFTLAEMIIVLGILAVMGAIGSRTYFVERDRFEFNNALTKTMQLVKTVRTYSTTSFPVYIKSIDKNITPLDGYGIQVNLSKIRGRSTLVVFANVGPGPDLQNFQKDDQPDRLDGNDIVLETYTLPQQIDFRYLIFKKEGETEQKQWKVDTEEPKNTGPTAFMTAMVFRPPLGDMAIYNDQFSPLEQLGLQFRNPAIDGAGPKLCQRISINRIKAFPELTYESTCF